MAVTYATGIRILQITCFIPALYLSCLLMFKNGLKAAAASWRFLAVLSALRIAGDIAYFVSLSDPSENTITTIVICDLIGISPRHSLLRRPFEQSVSLLNTRRDNLETNRLCCSNKAIKVLPGLYFTTISIVSLIGLGIGIAGARTSVDASSSLVSYHITGLAKAGLALLIAANGVLVFTLLVLFYFAYNPRADQIGLGREWRILIAVGISSPILLVHFVYAAIADYVSDPRFSLFDGNNTIYLCMSVLVEIIVTAIGLVAGLLTPPPLNDKKGGSESGGRIKSVAERDEEPQRMAL